MNGEITSQFAKPELRKMLTLLEKNSRQKYVSDNGRLTIGRSDDNNICLKEDVYVSGHHAEIFEEGAVYWLRDLNSRNGTMKNTENVTDAVEIQRGDVIIIGRAHFEVT